jgi:alkylhydroperoxidase/carboxymuconolactone decarboxylase family protein YurZ
VVDSDRPGQLDEIKPHILGALNLGWTVDELREALLRTAGYAGFRRLTRRSAY